MTNQAEITAECTNYYKDLYNFEPVDSEAQNYLLTKAAPLAENLADLCEGMITGAECTEAIKQMDNNKSPGSDGLPREFYHKLFHLFSEGFAEMLNNAYASKSLSSTQKLGIITLICKDQTSPEFLNNWRPLSLLNCDYKILSKVLANRLRKVL